MIKLLYVLKLKYFFSSINCKHLITYLIITAKMNAEKSNPRTRPTGVFQFTVQNYNAKKNTYGIKISCSKVYKMVVDIFLTQNNCHVPKRRLFHTKIVLYIHFLNINMVLDKFQYMYQDFL